MNRNYSKGIGLLAFLIAAPAAFGQIGGGAAYDPWCWPPPSGGTQPPGFSTDYTLYMLPFRDSDNQLFQVSVGAVGTDTWDKSCIGPNGATFNIPGRIGFSIGSLGSVQTTDDDYLRLNPGMPYMVGGGSGYAMVTTQATTGGAITKTLFGSTGFDTRYDGASDRYFTFATTLNSVRTRLQVDLIGDAARLNWQLTNTTTAATRIGLQFGQMVELLDAQGSGNLFGIADGSDWITVPGLRPLRVGTSFSTTPGVVLPNTLKPSLPMPPYIDFGRTQNKPDGLRVVCFPQSKNGKSDSDQTPIDELKVGHDHLLLGGFTNNSPAMPDVLLEDARFADYEDPNVYHNTGYLQKWYPTLVNAGETRVINAYYRSVSGNSDYAAPFSAVVDAPHLISVSQADPNVFDNNPATIRVYIDNTRGYSTIDHEIPLDNIRVELDLPPGMADAANPASRQLVKTISRVNPRQMRFVDFQVRISNELFGAQPYTVKIDAPTGASKLITGSINVAATPRLRLQSEANLVTSPWKFGNTSWEAILGLQVDVDFQAFRFDPLQKEYVISTGPKRGSADWLVMNAASKLFVLQGNPQEPDDLTIGSPLIQLQPGWNLVGNPYNYSVPLGQIIGVDSSNPDNAYSFADLVNQGLIAPALAYWDAESPTPEYRYIQDGADVLTANKGYWIFVNGSKFITLRYPPVLEPYLPARASAGWVQSDKQWRLQLVARNDKQADGQNFVGVAKSAADAKKLRAYEPPIAPLKDAISLSVEQSINGQPTKLAQALSETPGRQEFVVDVFSKSAGPTTITWPNLSSVPKNYQFRLVDMATGVTRNLRKASGYTYTAEERTTRKFKLQLEPGSVERAVIGSIAAVRSSRAANSPLSISYTLASDATTSLRILRGGQEIYVATRGRADGAGVNTVVWNLRDAANRAVAPGAYTVELTAESDNGDRVRKLYPVNIIR